MNIQKAREIPLQRLIEQLGGRQSHQRPEKGESWYYSPFRPQERTASFKVNERNNTWHDFGHSNKGGDVLDLWCDYHNLDRRSGVKQALEALKGFSPYLPVSINTMRDNARMTKENPSRYKLIKLSNRIFFASLKEELARRRISPELASIYLKQIYIQDTKDPNKKLNGIAFANDKGGYEISIPNQAKGNCFKTSIRPKAITTIEGKDETKASVFEGFWDFLSWLAMNKHKYPPHTCYVLNSNSFVGELVNFLEERKETEVLHLYFDNDDSGGTALNLLALQLETSKIIIKDMRLTYHGIKDLNIWWNSHLQNKSI